MNVCRRLLAVSALLATMSVLTPATAEQPLSKEAKLKADVLKWIRTKTKASDRELQVKLADQAEKFFRDSREFRYVLSSRVMKDRKPWLIEVHAGRFFKFPLAKEQAQKVLKRDDLVQIRSNKTGYLRVEPAPAKIGLAKIKNSDSLDGMAKVTGKVAFEPKGELSGRIAVRLNYRFETGVINRLHFLDSPPTEEGELKFSFPGINESLEPANRVKGPLVVFIDLCGSLEKPGDVEKALSNTLAVLVDVQ